MEHKFNIRVYYEDTDSGGVVYYANYLKFAERGRTELLRSGGLENKSLAEGDGIAPGIFFVVRHIEADYLSPAHLDDLLSVTTTITRLKPASLTMTQSIARDSTLLFKITVKLACVDVKSFRPAAIPDTIKNIFKSRLKES